MFQEDIFPPTFSGEPSMVAEEWIGGKNSEPNKIDLKDFVLPRGNKTLPQFSISAEPDDEVPSSPRVAFPRSPNLRPLRSGSTQGLNVNLFH